MVVPTIKETITWLLPSQVSLIKYPIVIEVSKTVITKTPVLKVNFRNGSLLKLFAGKSHALKTDIDAIKMDSFVPRSRMLVKTSVYAAEIVPVFFDGRTTFTEAVAAAMMASARNSLKYLE